MKMIKLTFQDNSSKEFEAGITTRQIVAEIYPKLVKKALAGKFNQQLIEMNQKISEDGSLIIVTSEAEDAPIVLKNSAILMLGMALIKLYPEIKLASYGMDEIGFYYDFENSEAVIEERLSDVENEMKELVKANEKINGEVMTQKEAIEQFKENPYKLELIKGSINQESYSLAKIGEHIDLVSGPQLQTTGRNQNFKLLTVSGAYWQGNSKNKMLQRIYGVAFFSKKELKDYLQKREEAKERDHRKIGKELNLFMTSQEVGLGLPFWLPKGATIRRIIERYIVDKEISLGYQHVYTPIMANTEIYKTSGHWEHYHEDMFPPMDIGDGELLVLRPMNCPHHMMLYKNDVHSYRELPIRIAELGMMHRYEKSGAVSGLQRVREMTLNDGHTFVRPDQVLEEFKRTIALMVAVYEDFNITEYRFRLSLPDLLNTEKYHGDQKVWSETADLLRKALKDLNLTYFEAEGEAAFYGPKLDVQVKTAMGMEETLSTIQLDRFLPEKFDLTYVGEDGEKHRAIVIHRGIVSTMERFVAYLTEIYKGAFPTWLAPVQVMILPVSVAHHAEYAETLKESMLEKGIRVEVDYRNEKLGYKIRSAQMNKVPFQVVVGDEEMLNNTLTVRRYQSKENRTMAKNDFIQMLISEINQYSRG